MLPSDFEYVLQCVEANPDRTARDLVVLLKKQGHRHFTSTLVNQVLYRLLESMMVDRDNTESKPRWRLSVHDGTISNRYRSNSGTRRPLSQAPSRVRRYLIGTREIRVFLDESMSPNDPYFDTEWAAEHQTVSINTNHPFWSIRLTSDGDRAIYCMIAAIDAYVLWKIAQLHEPPDSSESQKMRDYAFRFCTLTDAEFLTSD